MQLNQSGGSESRTFGIKVAGTDLKFRDVNVADPVPTGRQIIDAAGFHPAEEFIVIQYLPDRDLEELDLEETVDIRPAGSERFIIAKSDRTFRFEIDGRRHEWPETTISREVLLELAGQDPDKFSVWQEQRKAADKEIVTGQLAHLEPEGAERFYTVMKHTTEGGK